MQGGRFMDDRRPVKQIQPKANKGHNIVLEDRHKMGLSGVLNVESFNDTEIALETELGMLEVKGSSLHMNKLSLDTGDLLIEGTIDSCTYSQKQDLKTKGAGFFGKLFK
jgi:sporulation protein YabP